MTGITDPAAFLTTKAPAKGLTTTHAWPAREVSCSADEYEASIPSPLPVPVAEARKAPLRRMLEKLERMGRTGEEGMKAIARPTLLEMAKTPTTRL